MPAVWKKGVWVLWHQLCKVGWQRKGGLWDAEGCIHGAKSWGRQLRCDDQKLQEQELYPGACQWLNLQQGNEMLKQFHLFHMLMKISILYSLYVFLQHKWGASTVQWVPPRCSYISWEHPKDVHTLQKIGELKLRELTDGNETLFSPVNVLLHRKFAIFIHFRYKTY